ncbi:bacillithiol biosynthesis deacetylase BshB1 [Polluticaenibacter yanchengensis]|uniref:Bacillithiol biosynthesis deacetylase BshB1 n=1 Tax=Polluticaenibacter yanchengensis TaxID=3014562 RepID=A0ABT4UIH4_9BACT|nr:bacillithiol biosynthesis deacetylase BshB1 [Chitinophagaceae bacterium LY-5]
MQNIKYGGVMAIAAHPDDVELGCSGALLVEKSLGKYITLVDLTEGELGTRGTISTRYAEARDSAEILGVDARVNLRYPDGFFTNSKEYQLGIIEQIRHYRPDIVLANAPEDRHPDHGRAAQLIKDAVWLSGLRKIETRDENGQLQEPFRPANLYHFIQDTFLMPTFIYDISDVIDKKVASIKAYKTQFNTVDATEPETYISNPAFLENIIQKNAMLGRMIGVKYGEGFIANVIPGVKSFDKFSHKNR